MVCTKADLIDEEEDVALGTLKGKGGEWEERTDGVMQVLRTICLKCQCVYFRTMLRTHVLTRLFFDQMEPPSFTLRLNPRHSPFFVNTSSISYSHPLHLHPTHLLSNTLSPFHIDLIPWIETE